MEDKGKLAELRHVHRQLPEISRAGFKFIFCLTSLAILCISAVAQENTTDYWMERGEDLGHQGLFDEAVSAYDEVLKIDPGNETAWIRKASDLQVLGRENESLEAYEKAVSLVNEDLSKNPQDAKAWQSKAAALSSLNRPDEAKQAYEKGLDALNQMIEKNSKNGDAWKRKAHVLMNLGRWDEARAAYDEATKIAPQDYNAWWEKGQFLSSVGEINESMKAYDNATELIPANDTSELSLIWQDRAEELWFAERKDEAISALDRAIELDPQNSSDVWQFKGRLLAMQGRINESIAALDEALKLNPDDADTWSTKASLLGESKRYNDSLEAYDKAAELISEKDKDSKKLAVICMSKGQVLNKSGNSVDAKAAFQRSLDILDRILKNDSEDIDILDLKGLMLYYLERYDESVKVYDQVLTVSPKIEPFLTYIHSWISKGDSLRALGRNEEALVAYNKAIEVGPNFGNAWHGRGEAQRALGQVFNASMSFSVAEKLGYEG